MTVGPFLWTFQDAVIYAVLDPEDDHSEVHENNNIAWTTLDRDAISTRLEPDPPQRTDGPRSTTLDANYRNPFHTSTTTTYSIGRLGHVNLSVFDLMGPQHP